MADPRLVRRHQLTVDTYAAQHPAPQLPAVTTVFALLGLHWALERGLSGDQVRAGHKALADARRSWPALDHEPAVDEITVLAVSGARSPERHARELERWARSVLARWVPAWPLVVALTDEHWPLIARAAARARRDD